MPVLTYRDDILIPVAQPLLAQSERIYQDDNACPHRAKVDADYKQKQGI